MHQPGGPSLMSSLNYCQTAAGSRLLRSNILEPLTNWEKINQRLDAIEELTNRPTELLDPIKVRSLSDSVVSNIETLKNS